MSDHYQKLDLSLFIASESGPLGTAQEQKKKNMFVAGNISVIPSEVFNVTLVMTLVKVMEDNPDFFLFHKHDSTC